MERQGQEWIISETSKYNKKSLWIEDLIVLHLHLGDLCTGVWFDIALELAVITLFGCVFIKRFIRGIFLSQKEFVQWHSPPVAILTNQNLGNDVSSSCDILDISENMAEKSKETSFLRMERGIAFKRRTSRHIMFTNKACGLRITEVLTLSTSFQSSLAAQGIINFSPNQPFYILVVVRRYRFRNPRMTNGFVIFAHLRVR